MNAATNYFGCYFGDQVIRLSYYEQGAKDFVFDDTINRVTEDIVFNMNTNTLIGNRPNNLGNCQGCIDHLRSYVVNNIDVLDICYSRTRFFWNSLICR